MSRAILVVLLQKNAGYEPYFRIISNGSIASFASKSTSLGVLPSTCFKCSNSLRISFASANLPSSKARKIRFSEMLSKVLNYRNFVHNPIKLRNQAKARIGS